MRSSTSKCSVYQLENIDENAPAVWSAPSCVVPDTPTESMQFLARSWSLSATELSKALHDTNVTASAGIEKPLSCIVSTESYTKGSNASKDSDLRFFHQALNPEFLASQKLLRNGLYRSLLRGRTSGRWMKDHKERKKQEIRTHNAQLHAAVCVAGVAAAVATVSASTASSELTDANQKNHTMSAALASAAALVASHCIEIAEDMGAGHDQIATAVSSAINAKSNGDIMTLTAGAATALRGAATLKTRLQKGLGTTTLPLAEEKYVDGKEAKILTALDYVFTGGELLKRTRKGALHWKQVSFDVDSNLQVVVKMKSKYMAGTFRKKRKYIVNGVCSDIAAWPRRGKEDISEKKAYFGIKTADRIIEFECGSKGDKHFWLQGIQHMLNCHDKVI